MTKFKADRSPPENNGPVEGAEKIHIIGYLEDALDHVMEDKIDGIAVILLHVDGLVATAVAGKHDLSMVGGIERLKHKLIMGMEASEAVDRMELREMMREGARNTKQ